MQLPPSLETSTWGETDLRSQLTNLPLYGNLTEEEIGDVAMGLKQRRFKPRDELLHQGAKADGIIFVTRGEVLVHLTLPGGGEAKVAQLGPGSMIGELAMIRSATRSASVTAKTDVEAIIADWRYLTAALAQLRPGAFKIFRNMSSVLGTRTRDLYDKIHAAVFDDKMPYAMMRLPSAPPANYKDASDFDPKPFLPLLPCFRHFDSAELDAIHTASKVVAVDRGRVLAAEGQHCRDVFIVARGAIACGFVDDGRFHLINVRGPGSFCNVSSHVNTLPSNVSFVACENTLVLKFQANEFADLFMGSNRAAHCLLSAVIEHQANVISRATNHLKRLIGLSRVIQQLKLPNPASSDVTIT